MRAVLVEKLGQIPKLGEFHSPVPLDNEVLVKVLTASITTPTNDNANISVSEKRSLKLKYYQLPDKRD